MADAGTVALAALSVLGTLGGTLLGARLQASRQESEWWRNERKAAFVDLLTGLDRFQFALIAFKGGIQTSNPGDLRAAFDSITKILATIDSAISVLLVLVPEINEADLREVFDACLNDMTQAGDLAQAKGMSVSDQKDPTSIPAMPAEPRATAISIYEAHQRVVKLAHRFLGAKPKNRP